MSERKHTPGEWRVCDRAPGEHGYAIMGGAPGFYEPRIAYVHTSKADADLMAASKDMLAALEDALKDADWGLEDGDEYPPWVEQARAVITKARGE